MMKAMILTISTVSRTLIFLPTMRTSLAIPMALEKVIGTSNRRLWRKLSPTTGLLSVLLPGVSLLSELKRLKLTSSEAEGAEGSQPELEGEVLTPIELETA